MKINTLKLLYEPWIREALKSFHDVGILKRYAETYDITVEDGKDIITIKLSEDVIDLADLLGCWQEGYRAGKRPK